mmetsp:Transcript_26066/g.35547  ORF Transcript_26066/g.35547 Transcript_26066/m.35547 type:complete len:172 (+) Transcript_26066:824-1339(+)
MSRCCKWAKIMYELRSMPKDLASSSLSFWLACMWKRRNDDADIMSERAWFPCVLARLVSVVRLFDLSAAAALSVDIQRTMPSIWRCSVLKKPLEAAPSALECVSCAAGFFVPSRHHLAAGFAMLVLAGAERGGVLSIALAIGRQQLGSLPLSLARSLSLSLSLSQSKGGSG